MPTQTRWGAVLALILAGVIAALQIGKAAIALPVLQRELALTLAAASWIVGAYGLLGAAAGLPAGLLSALFSARRTLIAGLAAAGAGSLLGALADSGPFLIATRVAEGVGFLAVTLAVPRLLRGVTAPRDLELVLPLFGAYLPAGSVLMMLAGPYLLGFGWQALWWINGAAALAWAALVAAIPLGETESGPPADGALRNARAALFDSPGPALLALMFGIYTFHYMGLAGLLPTLLVERLGMSIPAAGMVAAAAVAANALGNMSAGPLLRLGVPAWAIAAGAFGFAAMAGFGIFADAMPAAGVAVLAAASLAVTGLVPGSVYATAPRFAATSAALAVVLGLINQTVNLGNLLGPAATAATIDAFGWSRAPLVILAAGVSGAVLALLLRQAMRRA